MNDSAVFDVEPGLRADTPYRRRLAAMFRNRAWLAAHIDALCREHADRWVVIDDQALKGSGASAAEALAQSGPIDDSIALVLMLPRRIPTPI
jgi:hypothetical protein